LACEFCFNARADANPSPNAKGIPRSPSFGAARVRTFKD
jgi:hypothetical protein